MVTCSHLFCNNIVPKLGESNWMAKRRVLFVDCNDNQRSGELSSMVKPLFLFLGSNYNRKLDGLNLEAVYLVLFFD